MKNMIIIYDDTVVVPSRIQSIIGKNTYGDIILKRISLFERFKNILKISKFEFEIFKIKNEEDLRNIDKIEMDNKVIFHYFSNYSIIDEKKFIILLNKMLYIKQSFQIGKNYPAAIAFDNEENYKRFVSKYINDKNINNYINYEKIESNVFCDISKYDNLLNYISGGFDARYFNSLEGDNYTVTKKSKDKRKMKMEYTYYWLLPEKMKNWMVMPYNFKEYDDYASYTMERLPMTDIAIRWTHQAISEEEFINILDKVFYFFSIRETKEIKKEEYKEVADNLYLKKVENRIKELKKCKNYELISNFIKNGTDFSSIDEIFEYYKKLYNLMTAKLYKNSKYCSVIGHGDVFFANMLYSKEINFLRLIDPKGALTEKELWTDPYYDIAKLSHSICGNYDFFNTGSYDIELDKNMKMELKIHFNNKKYKEIFKEYLKNNNYDFDLVRLYEASLFLSMLPIHIDNIHKVYGFILNAINILEELNLKK